MSTCDRNGVDELYIPHLSCLSMYVCVCEQARNEAELAAAAQAPLPADDDDELLD